MFSIFFLVKHDPVPGFQMHLDGSHLFGDVLARALYQPLAQVGGELRPGIGGDALGNDLPTLYNKINATNQAIVGFLKQKGITENEISINAPEIIDMQAERYNNNSVPFRYNVTSVITVTSTKVDLVRKMISEQSELLKQGIAITGGDYRYNVQYDYTGLNDIKPQMIEEATKNARAAAVKFAKDSDSELGKIKRAYQGQFSIEDRDANTPYIKRIRVVTTIDYSLED